MNRNFPNNRVGVDFLRPVCSCAHPSGVWWGLRHVPVGTSWVVVLSARISFSVPFEKVSILQLLLSACSPLMETQGF